MLQSFFWGREGCQVPLGCTQSEAARTLLWSKFCDICSCWCFPEVRVALLPPNHQEPVLPETSSQPPSAVQIWMSWGTVALSFGYDNALAAVIQLSTALKQDSLNSTWQPVRNQSCLRAPAQGAGTEAS